VARNRWRLGSSPFRSFWFSPGGGARIRISRRCVDGVRVEVWLVAGSRGFLVSYRAYVSVRRVSRPACLVPFFLHCLRTLIAGCWSSRLLRVGQGGGWWCASAHARLAVRQVGRDADCHPTPAGGAGRGPPGWPVHSCEIVRSTRTRSLHAGVFFAPAWRLTGPTTSTSARLSLKRVLLWKPGLPDASSPSLGLKKNHRPCPTLRVGPGLRYRYIYIERGVPPSNMHASRCTSGSKLRSCEQI